VKEKVLFIIHDLQLGGAQKVMSLIMKELLKSGYQVALVTNSLATSDFFPPGAGVSRYASGLSNPSHNIMQAVSSNFRRISKIKKVIKKEAPDVVFSFMTETNILTILATTFSGRRVIISERSDPVKDRKSPAWEFLRKLTYRRASLITSNNQGALDYLSKLVNKEKLVFLPNPIEGCDKCDGSGETDEGRKIILVAARLDIVKGVDILVDAFSILTQRFKKYQLWVVGDGPEMANLQHQAEASSIENNIQWLGKRNNLSEFYKKASVFVLPSRREGMPNAMLEAMSCGLPVIVSNASPGPLQYVEEGKTGLIFESGSPDSLADAIDRLLSDDAMRASMGKKAIEKVKPLSAANVMPVWEKVIFNRKPMKGNPVGS